VELITPHRKYLTITKTRKRRPRPDPGCSATDDDDKSYNYYVITEETLGTGEKHSSVIFLYAEYGRKMT
jgi:hypothetical protein